MNEYYSRYKEKVKKMKTRDKNRSFGDQLFPVYLSFTFGIFLIHLLSFCAATVYPAYHINTLTGSKYISLILAAIGVFTFIEVPKWSLIKTVFDNYYDDRTNKSYGMAAFGVFLITLSILSSTNGVPLVVKWFSPDAALVDIAAIEEKYNLELKAKHDYWKPQIQKHDLESKEYFSKNAKYYANEDRTRLSSSKSVRGPYNKMLASLVSAQSSLNDALKRTEQRKLRAIEKANIDNSAIIKNHESNKEDSGTVSFWIMLFLEALYVVGIGFIAYYNERSETEQEQPEETGQQQSKRTKVVKITDRTEPKQQVEKQVVASKQDKEPIGFKNHGSVHVPEGGTVPKVWYQTKKGGWASYSCSDLKRMIKKNTGSEEWKNELQEFANKLEEYKNNQS